MQSKFIKNIIVWVRILILFLLVLTLFIAKSLFLFLTISTFGVIILILFGYNVKKCISILKKIFIWLLFVIIIYIIIYRNITIFGLFRLIYKLVFSIILMDCVILNLNFDELHSGIYSILSPLKIFNIDLEKKSFEIAMNIVFFREFLNSSDRIEKKQSIKNKRSYRIKYFFFPRLLTSINYVDNLEEILKLKFYNLRIQKINFKSLILLTLFICLFVIAVFKEVIL